jgi:hypothetical protein
MAIVFEIRSIPKHTSSNKQASYNLPNHLNMRHIFTHIILIVISLFLPYSLIAQTSTWTGNLSSDWDTEGNWSPMGAPGVGNQVTIPASGTANRPTLTHDVVVYQLSLNGEIDMKGFKIDAQGGGFIINNATVKNSDPGSTSTFSGENHENSESFRIDGSTFEGNVGFKILSDLPQYEAYTAANHYKGNVQFIFAHKLPGPSEYTNPSICKNHASVFEKKLLIVLHDFDAVTELTIADGGIIFGGSSDSEISGVYENLPTYDLQPLTLVIKDAKIKKTGAGKIIVTDDWFDVINISNSLSFEGGIIDNPNGYGSITFRDNATHSGASDQSHITGPVFKIGDDAFTFPIGTGSKYTPLAISAPSSSTVNFRALYYNSSATVSGFDISSKASTLESVYNGGFWSLARYGGSSSVSVTLGYNVASGVITSQGKLRVAHWNGSIWEDLGKSGTSGSLTVGTVSSALEASSFSPFTFAFLTSLPVTLTAFSAQSENQTARLQWTTTEETNSNKFEIEHSRDAKNWQKIGERKATGESTSVIHYDYLHSSPLKGLNYYRLKMIDQDGSYAFSRIENLKFSSELKTTVYPNPVADRLFIDPINGETVLSAEIKAVNGISTLTASEKDTKTGIDLSGLTEGIYLLEISMKTGRKEIHKILINK